MTLEHWYTRRGKLDMRSVSAAGLPGLSFLVLLSDKLVVDQKVQLLSYPAVIARYDSLNTQPTPTILSHTNASDEINTLLTLDRHYNVVSI